MLCEHRDVFENVWFLYKLRFRISMENQIDKNGLCGLRSSGQVTVGAEPDSAAGALWSGCHNIYFDTRIGTKHDSARIHQHHAVITVCVEADVQVMSGCTQQS